MFAIEPFIATRKILRMRDDALKTEWQPCRVMGVTEKDGEPVYVVEVYGNGDAWLDTADVIRRD